MSVVGGVYAHLAADTDITDEIGTYDYGSGSQPAIFTTPDYPEDAATRFLVVSSSGGFLDGRDRGHRGGVVLVNVTLWGSKGDSEKSLRELADTLWFSLDRASIVASGFEVVYCLADPPQRLTDREGYPGFSVSCRILVRKE